MVPGKGECDAEQDRADLSVSARKALRDLSGAGQQRAHRHKQTTENAVH
ncbi:hypothetical protein PanABDRAFT_3300 [Pantoea sp. aB]|nr:hypothetical protein PanABDRAFT_3300 [Pantoea sp. aB]